MVAFTMSCFGLLTFLWISFGGPTPLKPEGYRFKARFTEAPLLVNESDVRIAGLNVGKVKDKVLDPAGATIVEMEIDSKYAPIPTDTEAILRPKSLLGQTYVELTPGSRTAPKLQDDATLDGENVEEAVDIDELIRTFDKPTRRAFQGWVKELATAIDGRGEDLNDALGNLPRFAASGADVLAILDENEPALHRLIRNASLTLGALNERRDQFQELIQNANGFFGALASRNEALADTIEILPTFLDESKATIARLERFAVDTRPLVRDLQPVARDLRPTLRDIGRLSPDLEALFRDLDPLIKESRKNLPPAARFIRGAGPLLAALHPYLEELNPIIGYLSYQQQQVADFITNGSASLNGALPAREGEGPRHYLRAVSVINSRGLAIQRTRTNYDRGNSYPAPNYQLRARPLGIFEAFDCKPTNGEKVEPEAGVPPCFVQPPHLYGGTLYPRPTKGEDDLVPSPRGTDGGTRPPARP
ncbi:MAG TPA: MlaD family protein [Thermoleophilaceae bacterium]|nr:MlaD family protein [Thermoleophilaceae bacterium]